MNLVHTAAARCARRLSAWSKFALVMLFPIGVAGCAHVPPTPPVAQQWRYPEDSSWGEACERNAPQQSPIDFRNLSPERWDRSTVITQNTFVPGDQNVLFLPTPGPSVSISPPIGSEGKKEDGVTYVVAGFHFHVLSEHQVRGTATLEMHIKTIDQSDGSTAVFAVLWEGDNAEDIDPTLRAASQALASTEGGDIRAVDIGRLLWMFSKKPFYTYVGSLTTPPCSPNIRWYVLQTPLKTPHANLIELTSRLRAFGMPVDNWRRTKPIVDPGKILIVTPKRN